jgi:hypothetical protein
MHGSNNNMTPLSVLRRVFAPNDKNKVDKPTLSIIVTAGPTVAKKDAHQTVALKDQPKSGIAEPNPVENQAEVDRKQTELAINLFHVTKIHLASSRQITEGELHYKELTGAMPNVDHFLFFASQRPPPFFDLSRQDFVIWTKKYIIGKKHGPPLQRLSKLLQLLLLSKRNLAWHAQILKPVMSVDKLFQSIDGDGDGLLSLAELEDVLGVVAAPFLRVVCNAEENADASEIYATPDQFRAWAACKKPVNKKMHNALEVQLRKVRDGVVKGALDKFEATAVKLHERHARLHPKHARKTQRTKSGRLFLAAENLIGGAREAIENAGERTGFV